MTSFEDGVRAGMEKAAASVEELQAAYNRAGIVRLTRGGGREDPKHGPFAVLRSKNERFIGRRDASAWKNFPDVQKEFLEMQKTIDDTNAAGKAFMTRGGMGPVLPKKIRPKTPEGWKAVNIVSGLHEVGERRVKPHQAVADWTTHASPKVIFDEYNMVNKMTGPGSDEARSVFNKLRRTARGHEEIPEIRDLIKKSYGQRGWDYVKKNGFTKAMKKNLLSKYTGEEAQRAAAWTAQLAKKAL